MENEEIFNYEEGFFEGPISKEEDFKEINWTEEDKEFLTFLNIPFESQ